MLITATARNRSDKLRTIMQLAMFPITLLYNQLDGQLDNLQRMTFAAYGRPLPVAPFIVPDLDDDIRQSRPNIRQLQYLPNLISPRSSISLVW